MTFKFYLRDYTNSDGSTEVEVNEPVAFDSFNMVLLRNETYHGVNVEYSDFTLEFVDEAALILSAAYDVAGIDAFIKLRIAIQPEEGDAFEDLYVGNIVFRNYVKSNDTYCSVKVEVEKTGDLMTLLNAQDTAVDLQAAKSFDGTTDLVPYTKLPFTGTLESKAILFTDLAEIVTIETPSDFEYSFNFRDINSPGFSYFYIPFKLVSLEEMAEFSPLTTLIGDGPTPTSTPDLDSYYVFKAQKNQTVNISGLIKLLITVNPDPIGDFVVYPAIKVYKINGVTSTLLDTIYSTTLDNPTDTDTETATVDTSFDYTYALSINDQITIVLECPYVTLGNSTLTVDVHIGTKIKITALDTYAATPCKLFMINEAFSRIIEAVTDNRLKVYSDFFGRTDAQPYVSEADGCGSLEAITKGVFVRQIELTKPTVPPIFSLSFNDILSAMTAVHNIGWQVEPDPNRTGYDRIRIELMEHFYDSSVIYDLGSVYAAFSNQYKSCFKNFIFGYNKWEAEEYNGLDEFLTKREYRTNFANANQTFSKLCSFVASGYAIEVTRRKGNATTKDWRMDEDTFLICMKRDGGNIVVEQGNIDTSPVPANIVDPPTVYNFRISPIRMALRWIKHVWQASKNIASAKLIFTSGEANYYAKGSLINSCKLEILDVQENQEINSGTFSDINEATPIIHNVYATISKIPMSFQDWNSIRTNPNGLIKFNSNGVDYYGYINKITYVLANGEADIVLVLKR